MIKYRFQWPFEIIDCHECGKGLHFQKPWKRVYNPRPLSDLERAVVDATAGVMVSAVSMSLFSRDAVVNIQGGTVTIPKVGNFGFSESLWTPSEPEEAK